MAESDDLIRAAEQHLMVAHDAAAAHGADADLLGVTLLADGGAVIDVMVWKEFLGQIELPSTNKD